MQKHRLGVIPLGYTLLLVAGVVLSSRIDSQLLRTVSIVFGGLSILPLYRWERQRKGYSREWLLGSIAGSYALLLLAGLIAAFVSR